MKTVDTLHTLVCTRITLNDITALNMLSTENKSAMVDVVGIDISFPYQSFNTNVSFCVHGLGIIPFSMSHS